MYYSFVLLWHFGMWICMCFLHLYALFMLLSCFFFFCLFYPILVCFYFIHILLLLFYVKCLLAMKEKKVYGFWWVWSRKDLEVVEEKPQSEYIAYKKSLFPFRIIKINGKKCGFSDDFLWASGGQGWMLVMILMLQEFSWYRSWNKEEGYLTALWRLRLHWHHLSGLLYTFIEHLKKLQINPLDDLRTEECELSGVTFYFLLCWQE